MNSATPRTARAVAAIVLGGILCGGCARLGLGFTKIGDLLAKPENYAGKEILIRGKVSSALDVPLVGIRLYSVSDSTGEIKVRTDKEPPPSGSDVHVRGMLDTVATIDNRKIGLHLREIERW